MSYLWFASIFETVHVLLFLTSSSQIFAEKIIELWSKSMFLSSVFCIYNSDNIANKR